MKKIKRDFLVSGWFQGFQNLIIIIFLNLQQIKFSYYFQTEIIPWRTHVFGFSNSIPYGLEESREFSVSRHTKNPKIKPLMFFFIFELPLWIY